MLDAAAVKAIARSLGAAQCGIARTDSFMEAPEGFRPRDINDPCRSLVVFLKLMNDELGNMGGIGAVLTSAEREPDPPLPGSPCPDGCRVCIDACPENALVGKTVIQQRCRKSSIVQVGRNFCIHACHKCRSECPRSLGWGRGPWRADFKNLAK